MKNLKNITVFGYVRVSTENQLENYSIEEQIERIEAFCKAKGWLLLKTYTDGGFSGGNTNRPALQQMLREIHKKSVDAVVVYKLDRLSRSQKDTLTLIEDEFLAHNVDFVSINENFDTSTPFGRAMIGILSVFAQLEKDQITERFTMGRIGRSKAGYFHGGGNAPFAYHYVNGLLEVDIYQAEIVREVFKKFLSGKSINAIATETENKYSGSWSATKVYNIIKNSIYIGKVKFRGEEHDGVHQPIIDYETFTAANRLLTSSERKQKLNFAQKTPFRAETLLSGLVYCTWCGARYSGSHGYYKCYSRSKNSKKYVIDPNCKNDHWEISVLDSIVIHEINHLIESQDTLKEILHTSASPSPQIDAAAIHKRIKEIESQINKLIDLYQVSGVPISSLTQRITELNQESGALQQQLQNSDNQVETAIERFQAAIIQYCEKFEFAPLETRRILIRSLVKQVRLDGKSVKIAWRI